jgi:hypothetical protein
MTRMNENIPWLSNQYMIYDECAYWLKEACHHDGHLAYSRGTDSHSMRRGVIQNEVCIHLGVRAEYLRTRWESNSQDQAGCHVMQEQETYMLDGRVMVRFRLVVASCKSERLTN